jgi:hypothetical protein
LGLIDDKKTGTSNMYAAFAALVTGLMIMVLSPEPIFLNIEGW